MNANPKFIAATAHVDEAAVKPLPRSRKVYIEGSRPDIRVPMREISQADTAVFGPGGKSGPESAERNPPIFVYDCSGPYTDPTAKIDIRQGLPALRAPWIEERADTEVLIGPSSRFGAERLRDPKLAELRFGLERKPRRARAGRTSARCCWGCTTSAGCASPAASARGSTSGRWRSFTRRWNGWPWRSARSTWRPWRASVRTGCGRNSSCR